MRKLALNHQFTPPELVSINQTLATLLADESLDEKSFHSISIQRDACIKEYLDTLEPIQKAEFCKAEIEINDVLVQLAQQLFDTSLKQLSGLIRGRKAVKKYY
ncbi:hypothetical protein WNY77_06935 [Paraglaciecola mesophila]|uniref:Uncharacterized protein n=1 Tax=Paraglaciecola mesophila TaxID=197222 RepID=A0ABU9STA7_9ALTE